MLMQCDLFSVVGFGMVLVIVVVSGLLSVWVAGYPCSCTVVLQQIHAGPNFLICRASSAVKPCAACAACGACAACVAAVAEQGF